MIMEQRNRNIAFKTNLKFLLRVLILHFLTKNNYYGEELKDLICTAMANEYTPSNGTIYPVLHEMEENLLIEGFWSDPHIRGTKLYRITDTGMDYYMRMRVVLANHINDTVRILNSVLKYIK